MKKTLLLLIAVATVSSVQASTVIYSDDFSGSSSTPLNGTVTDVGNGTWVANSAFYADGHVTADYAAWLPYTFGLGVYELSASVSASSDIAGISFCSALTTDKAFLSDTSVFATLAIRYGGMHFWGGPANNGSIQITGIKVTSGIIRLVLDTTKANWTIDGYYTSLSGGTEIHLDLNGSADGYTYTFGSNQPSQLAGAGLIARNGANYNSFILTELSAVPKPATVGLSLGGR